MKVEEVKKRIEEKLKTTVESDSKLYNAYLLIHSEKQNIHWNLAAGRTDGREAISEQPFHTASIGKTFTSVLIAMLVEQGKLNYQDLIAKYLSEDILKGLHLYKGEDYSKQLTIEHLVSNTAGLPDFYEEKPKEGSHF